MRWLEDTRDDAREIDDLRGCGNSHDDAHESETSPVEACRHQLSKLGY
jgi:hypothetical protein